jgi:hypothetical protein
MQSKASFIIIYLTDSDSFLEIVFYFLAGFGFLAISLRILSDRLG